MAAGPVAVVGGGLAGLSAGLELQRLGFEWAYRLSREPLRLAARYAKNGLFALRMLARDAVTRRSRRH